MSGTVVGSGPSNELNWWPYGRASILLHCCVSLKVTQVTFLLVTCSRSCHCPHMVSFPRSPLPVPAPLGLDWPPHNPVWDPIMSWLNLPWAPTAVRMESKLLSSKASHIYPMTSSTLPFCHKHLQCPKHTHLHLLFSAPNVHPIYPLTNSYSYLRTQFKVYFCILYSKWNFVIPSCPTFLWVNTSSWRYLVPTSDVVLTCTVSYLTVFFSTLNCEHLQGRACVLFTCVSPGPGRSLSTCQISEWMEGWRNGYTVPKTFGFIQSHNDTARKKMNDFQNIWFCIESAGKACVC